MRDVAEGKGGEGVEGGEEVGERDGVERDATG